jgi:hypothetical protein
LARRLPRAHLAQIEPLKAINTSIAEAVARQDALASVHGVLAYHRTLDLRARAPAMLARTETVWLQPGPTMRAPYDRQRRNEPPQHPGHHRRSPSQ